MQVSQHFVDRHALDVTPSPEYGALVGRAAIEQVRDAGMIEVGEDLALVAEAARPQYASANKPRTSLIATCLSKRVVGSRRQVDHAHAAAPELANQLVRTDALPGT
mgnify:CR=1 FL=1